MGTSSKRQTPQERKLYALCDEVGLDREMRIDWACYQLRRDITSFSQLTNEQVFRLLDGLEGYQLITELKSYGASPAEHSETDVVGDA